jgi:acyl-CoA thioesterase I
MTSTRSAARIVRAYDLPIRLSRRSALGRLGAAGLAATIAAQGALGADARDAATPAAVQSDATPPEAGEPSEDRARIEASVRYQHPEKAYFYMPGFGNESVIASFYGLDVASYRSIKEEFATTARTAAQEFLADSAFAERVDGLPFQPGETVVVIGESDTDDLLSWLEILRHLLDLRRSSDEIRVVNAAISGQTTTEALGRVAATIGMERANRVICGLGGNDATRQNAAPDRTLVTLEETTRNLASMRQVAAAADPEIAWVWMTRWPIDEARIAAYPGFQQGQVSWRNDDVAAINEVVRRQPEPVVDLEPVFGRPPTPDLLEDDGLHPSLAGHKRTVRALVETLSA